MLILCLYRTISNSRLTWATWDPSFSLRGNWSLHYLASCSTLRQVYTIMIFVLQCFQLITLMPFVLHSTLTIHLFLFSHENTHLKNTITTTFLRGRDSSRKHLSYFFLKGLVGVNHYFIQFYSNSWYCLLLPFCHFYLEGPKKKNNDLCSNMHSTCEGKFIGKSGKKIPNMRDKYWGVNSTPPLCFMCYIVKVAVGLNLDQIVNWPQKVLCSKKS